MPAEFKTMKPSDGERDLYLDLVREVPLRPIRSDGDLARAIAMIDRLSDRESLGDDEDDYLDVLSGLVERYESETEPEPVVSPADMLRHLIEAKGSSQVAVAAATGISESTLSEILTGKRGISRKAMRSLGEYFRVDPAIFL